MEIEVATKAEPCAVHDESLYRSARGTIAFLMSVIRSGEQLSSEDEVIIGTLQDRLRELEDRENM